jgi:hypothetical protein
MSSMGALYHRKHGMLSPDGVLARDRYRTSAAAFLECPALKQHRADVSATNQKQIHGCTRRPSTFVVVQVDVARVAPTIAFKL